MSGGKMECKYKHKYGDVFDKRCVEANTNTEIHKLWVEANRNTNTNTNMATYLTNGFWRQKRIQIQIWRLVSQTMCGGEKKNANTNMATYLTNAVWKQKEIGIYLPLLSKSRYVYKYTNIQYDLFHRSSWWTPKRRQRAVYQLKFQLYQRTRKCCQRRRGQLVGWRCICKLPVTNLGSSCPCDSSCNGIISFLVILVLQTTHYKSCTSC